MLTLYLYDINYTVNIIMDFNAFSHGQIHSKIWLCEILEPFLRDVDDIAILGSWYNILGFMLNVRKPNYYKSITGYDIDSDAIRIADSVTESWRFLPDNTLENLLADVNTVDYTKHDTIINTSVEHMLDNNWFNKITSNTLVCIQSSTLGTEIDYFKVTNKNSDIAELKQKYPLSKIVYEGVKDFDYPINPYKRLMIIGYK